MLIAPLRQAPFLSAAALAVRARQLQQKLRHRAHITAGGAGRQGGTGAEEGTRQEAGHQGSRGAEGSLLGSLAAACRGGTATNAQHTLRKDHSMLFAIGITGTSSSWSCVQNTVKAKLASNNRETKACRPGASRLVQAY